MDSFMFDDYNDEQQPERPVRAAGRAKPVKRKWREIEALKDRQQLREELLHIDMFSDIDDNEYDFLSH